MFEQTPRNQVKRKPQRASYDKETIFAIFDEALICHVAFVQDGQPYIIPTLHARLGDTLYLHGANPSRLMKHLAEGGELSAAATLVDGILFARSAFNHSFNFRSAVLYGQGRPVVDPREKMQALQALTEHVARGRWADCRQPNQAELDATAVAAIDIVSGSAKIHADEYPSDQEGDRSLAIWAGTLPLSEQAGAALPDPRVPPDAPVPEYIRSYTRKK